MSRFWSAWVMGLVTLNLGITFFLFLWGQRINVPTQPDGTTGHVWAHGVLRESVRHLPRWWVLFSAGLFLWGFAFLVLFPGFGAFPGVLQWTSAGKLERETAANDVRLESTLSRIRGVPIETLARDPAVTSIGAVLFEDNCAACHGRDARGNQALGSPNLVDGNSLYGNDASAVLTSILDGRRGVMPPLGGVLGHQGANEAAAYVLTLNGYQAPADWVAAGKLHFDALCVACHGADGQGNTSLGAPDLTDDVWLYGRDFNRMTETIRDGRSGNMPAWRERLGEERARAIAAWVYAAGQREHGATR
jgi:cytochrome c oxidase cbb3-type subunit 3